MSDEDDVAVPRKRKTKRRALRVPVDDVPRRSAVSELPAATPAAKAAGEAALEPPPEPPKKPAPATVSSMPPARSSYPPPPPDGKVVMRDSVRVTSKSADEADMLDPFAEMPDADIDTEPLAPESTQVLADDDLESLDVGGQSEPPSEEPASVEVSIDELDEAEAEAIEAAAEEAAAVSASAPPPPPAEMAPTDTVPGVSLEELAQVADEVGVVDEADDDEPELTVTESDELDLDEDDDLEELDDDELEDSTSEPPPAPPEEAKKAPPAPPVEKAPPAPPPTEKAPPAPPVEKAPPAPPEAKKKKRRKPWFEGFFSDDYLRTVRPPTPKEVAKECDFILGQLALPRGSTILDVGCGLGLHAIELTRRGYLVVGLDLSLPMLSRAGDEAQDEGLRINFLHGDMRQMTFEGQFDAVLCWGTTFGYFDDDGNREVVQRLLESLKPGGLLLLDIVNRDHVLREQPNLVWFEGDGCVCMEESRFDYLRSRLHVKRTVILDDGRQRENTYSLRLYAPHEIGQLLHQKGFRVTSISGMKATPGVFFGATSPELIILAERRPDPAVRNTAKLPVQPDDLPTDTSAETKPGTEPAPEGDVKSEPPPTPDSEPAPEAKAKEPPPPPAAGEAKEPPPPPAGESKEPPSPDEVEERAEPSTDEAESEPAAEAEPDVEVEPDDPKE
ncbi:MAG: class I SAM-dependent methyltransferase [Deltaproteobacteria bacterium]|nr:class I SAM-dependent methyltransferase [Deltaproteobacteria bacterium]